MGHGRLRWTLVAGAVLVASIGLPASPASAAPGTTPTFVSPAAGPVSGDVDVVVSSTANAVQFFLNDVAYGPQVTVNAGTASAQWPTWSRPDGDYTWTAADCDLVDCNLTPPLPARTFAVANNRPTITAPANGSVVSGNVTVSATSAAPFVQFYVDTVALGSPVAVSGASASATWATAGLLDGAHTVAAAACDVNGCNPAQSSVTVTTVNSGPTITPADGSTVGGVVSIDATTAAKQVQFSLNGNAVGGPVSVSAGKASITWTTWGLANGPYAWTAAAVCDNPGCTRPQSTVNLTVDNVTPTIAAPSNNSVVSGNVTVSATSAAPFVQFYVDTVALGSPVAVSSGSASALWSTSALLDGAHTVAAAACDVNGCNSTQSSVTVTTVNSGPTITPADGSTVGGVVSIDAATAAKQVQFSLNGNAVGGPVSVSAGKASITWTTWGLANGPYAWTAAAVCDNPGCTRPQSTVNLTLANTAPSVTSPADGATTDSTITIDASAPGGGLAFFVNGAKVGFDASAPYSFTPSSPLGLGSHTASVKECDLTGATCNGPSSPTVTFTVSKLSPSITSVSPNPFSPGDDGAKDSTTFRVHLPGPQYLTYRVENNNGQTVNGPRTPGVVSTGNHTYTWEGRNNAGKVVPDGTYTIVVETTTGSGASMLEGSDRLAVRVDHSPTSFSAVTGRNATFYPVVDGYLDTFRPTVTVNEGGRLWMQITTRRGARVRLVARPHASVGTFQLVWNGRDSKNALMPAGDYTYRFLAEDRAGNRRISRPYRVHLSHRRTVRKTVNIGRNGDMGRVSTTNAHCTLYSLGFSNFNHGLWLNNGCDRGFEGTEFIYADYTIAVPGAVRYDDIRVRTTGVTTHAPEPISALVYNFADHQWDAAGSVRLTRNGGKVDTTFGRISGAQRVNLRHRVRIRIAVPDQVTPQDYDIKRASIIISYRRLQ